MTENKIIDQLVEATFKLSRFIRETMQNNSKVTHLSMLQLQALLCIKKKPDIQMRDIANCFRIELPSATSLINKLHNLQLVERNVDSKDRRLVRINLTDKGQSLLKDAMIESNKKLGNLFTTLSEKDRKELLRILTELIEKNEK